MIAFSAGKADLYLTLKAIAFLFLIEYCGAAYSRQIDKLKKLGSWEDFIQYAVIACMLCIRSNKLVMTKG